jgi:hypothetical protein
MGVANNANMGRNFYHMMPRAWRKRNAKRMVKFGFGILEWTGKRSVALFYFRQYDNLGLYNPSLMGSR